MPTQPAQAPRYHVTTAAVIRWPTCTEIPVCTAHVVRLNTIVKWEMAVPGPIPPIVFSAAREVTVVPVVQQEKCRVPSSQTARQIGNSIAAGSIKIICQR